jgi:hypothetical protein
MLKLGSTTPSKYPPMSFWPNYAISQTICAHIVFEKGCENADRPVFLGGHCEPFF